MSPQEWFSSTELLAAGLPGLPRGKTALHDLIMRERWRDDGSRARRSSRQGGGWEYHISLLPPLAQAQLKMAEVAEGEPRRNPQRDALWQRYEALPERQKAVAAARLRAVRDVLVMAVNGTTAQAAAALIARREGVSVRTIYNWQEIATAHPREDWLAALAPAYRSERDWAPCHERAWECLTSDYLRPEQPTFSACYRRVKAAAKEHGWQPLPSERALRRRLDAEVPQAVQVVARSTKDKAKALYPAQRRTRDHLHAMEAVNMDGHKFDVFVRMPDGTITRLYLIALQDLYSGKFVAWRLSDSENKETTRLVIGDMVERYGIPERITLDNGRAFASKWITGGARSRYRYRVRDEDPQGLLTTLGIELQFTKLLVSTRN